MQTIREIPMKSLATCDPVNAIARAEANGANTAELRFLRSLLAQLDGKTDRFTTTAITNKARAFANS